MFTDAAELISNFEDLYSEREVVGTPLPIYFMYVFFFRCMQNGKIEESFQ